MRAGILCFFLGLLGPCFLGAQNLGSPSSAPGQCSLTLLNALPGPGNLRIKLGPEDIWPPGFTPGQSTGGVLFPSGKKSLELACEGFVNTKTEIVLPTGANFAMIFFPGEEITEGPDKGKRKIGMFAPPPILPNQPPTGKNWQMLLAGPLAQASLKIDKKPLNLVRGQPIDLGSEKGQMIVENGDKLLFAANPDENGNYWVVVFGDKPDSLQAALLNHIRYTVP